MRFPPAGALPSWSVRSMASVTLTKSGVMVSKRVPPKPIESCPRRDRPGAGQALRLDEGRADLECALNTR